MVTVLFSEQPRRGRWIELFSTADDCARRMASLVGWFHCMVVISHLRQLISYLCFATVKVTMNENNKMCMLNISYSPVNLEQCLDCQENGI